MRQDLFAELRPNMIRYLSIEEVNAALIELEEHELRVSSEKAHNDMHSDTEKHRRRNSSGTLSVNGQILANGTEENVELHEEFAGETDIESGSGTIEHVDNDEESDEVNEGESDDDYEDWGEPASDEDDEVHVRQKVAEVDPQEVADFNRELRALMQASGVRTLYFSKILLINTLQIARLVEP